MHRLVLLAITAICFIPASMGVLQDPKEEPIWEYAEFETIQPTSLTPVIQTTTTTTTEAPFDWETVTAVVSAVETYAAAIAPPPPPPPPRPTPAARSAPAPVEAPGWAREAVEAYFPADQVERALRIMRCESTFQPGVTNPSSGTRGLFQIHPGWSTSWGWPGPLVSDLGYTWDQMYEVWPNVHVAYVIWSNSGWGPWTCRG